MDKQETGATNAPVQPIVMLPRPFCGFESAAMMPRGAYQCVECLTCGCGGAPHNNPVLAAETWNTRAAARSKDDRWEKLMDEIAELEHGCDLRDKLLDRALTIINDAIMHGMPVTEEVAAVSNEIRGTAVAT